MSPSHPHRTGSLPALPNKPFQAPRRSRASTSTSKSPVQLDDTLKTALQRLKEYNNKLSVPPPPPPKKSADPLYALWAGVLPQVGSLNSTTLVRATEAIPIEALEGNSDITKEAIDAVVTEVERVQVTDKGADDDAQDWKVVAAWLQGLAEMAARQQRRNGEFIEAHQNRFVVGNLYHVADRDGIDAGGIFAGPAPNQGMGTAADDDDDEFDFGSLLLDGFDDDFLAQLEGGGGGVTQDRKKPLPPPPRSHGAPSPHHDPVALGKIKGTSQSSSLAAVAAAGGTLANGIGGPPSTLGGGGAMVPPGEDRVAQSNDHDDDDEHEAVTSRAVDKGKARAVSPLLRRSRSPTPDVDSHHRGPDRTGSIDEQMREEDLAAQKQAQLERTGSRVPVQPPSRPVSSARPPTVVRPKAKEPIPKKSQQGLFQRPNLGQQDGDDDEEEVDMLDDDEEELPVVGPSKPKGTGRRKKAVAPREEAEEEEDQLASSDPGAAAPPPPAQVRKARKAPRVDGASKSGGKAKKERKAVQQRVGKRGSAHRDYTSSEEEEKAGSAAVRKGKRKAGSSAGSASEEKNDGPRTRAANTRGSLPPPPKRRSTRSASISTVNSAGTAASGRKALKPKDANVKPNRSKSKAAGGKRLAAAEVALREKEGKDKKGKVKPERERKEGTRKSSRPSIGRAGAKENGEKETAAFDPELKAGKVGYKQNQTDGSRCWPVLVLKVGTSRIAFASLPGPNTAAPAKIEIVPMILSVPPIVSKPDEVPLLPPPRQLALKAAMAFLRNTDRYEEWREQAEEEWKRVAAEYGMEGEARADEKMEGGDEGEDERRSSASGSEDSE